MQTTLVGVTVARDTDSLKIAPEDFGWIMRRHQRRIYRILFLLVRDPDEADNLTQECFLRAFAKYKDFRGDASLETWLVRIAINLAYDHTKNRRRAFWKRLIRGEVQPWAEPADQHRSPEHLLLARERVATVWAAAGALPTQQKVAFLLRFAEEMSLEEVADAMGLEVGTVKSHLTRALGSVKEHLERSGTSPQRPPKQCVR